MYTLYVLPLLLYHRDIEQAFELGCLEEELLEFLLAHSVTEDEAARASFAKNMNRCVT